MSLVLVLGLLVAAYVVFWKRGYTPWLRIVLYASTLIITALSLLHFGVGQITGGGFDDSVFYHLRTGLGGGDVSQYFWMIGLSLLAFVAFSREAPPI